MEKKHISIIGSCVSRNLFNTTLLKNVFEIDQYICQICEFALFDSGLNIKKEDIYKANIPEFTSRCFNYELNKTAIDELKQKKSEYILIDLHNISSSIYEASIDDFKNSVYTQSSGHDLFNYLPYLNNVNNLKRLKLKEIKFVEFDKTIIENGLIRLSEFLKENYEESKIIIHIPKRVKLYSDINGLNRTEENWKNTWAYSVGLDYDLSDVWVLRAGVQYDETGISSEEHRTARIPDNDRIITALGGSYKFNGGQIDMAYAHIFLDDNYADYEGLNSNYSMGVNMLSFAVQYYF